nr:hypothetical protein [uncultured Rhodoferax sp.]
MTDLDPVRKAAALDKWALECKGRMEKRWPKIDFDSDLWPLRSLYNTNIQDINLAPVLKDLSDKDPAYAIVLRCSMAEVALKGEVKSSHAHLNIWRLMAHVDTPLHALKRENLVALEVLLVKKSSANEFQAAHALYYLSRLSKQVERLSKRGAIDGLIWSPSFETKSTLTKLAKQRQAKFKQSKASELDHQIEALSDATTAMFQKDPRLSAYDQVTLAAIGISMCAPSRINEPLCMSVNDSFTLEDYVARPNGFDKDTLHRTHQLLLMKGSKGADWGAKPILNFMIDMVGCCIEVIKQHGQRSRMLVQWYERNPTTLYLPPALEHLRGKDITRIALWQITGLSDREVSQKEVGNSTKLWKQLVEAKLLKSIPNPKLVMSNGRKAKWKTVQAVAWSDLEPILLAKVGDAMDSIRRVTIHNTYQGPLSNMLMLFDSDQTPYLPDAVTYTTLAKRLKPSVCQKRESERRGHKLPEPTIFEKLEIRMVVNGTVQTAYIETHDPRRWLTTQALAARERLSDVLINKWANRLDIKQLAHYDFRTADMKANQAAMPQANELVDLSAGLQKLQGIEAEYGLSTEIVVAHEAGISVTSMDAIVNATETRPVAKTSNQIIIIYAHKYGGCLHQHHETPCRAYRCLPCDNSIVVKGHLPSNENIRRDYAKAHRSIVTQLRPLMLARERGIADDAESLDSHLLTLVEAGLSPELMTDELITRYLEFKDSIKDVWFKNKLEEAFVSKKYVDKLDDQGTSSGALMKYHNPSCHASPSQERAMEAVHGDRAANDANLKAFQAQYPQFGPTTLGLKDERDQLLPDADGDVSDD